jgi:hypothetical protein
MSKWVRVRGKRVNLDYGILAEEFDGTPETGELLPGGLRLTVETGRVLVFPPGPDADKVLRAIDDEIDGSLPAAGGPPRGTVGVAYDPFTGAPLPRQPVEGGVAGRDDLRRDDQA